MDLNNELVIAVEEGDLGRVKSLITQGADVNACLGHIFSFAAESNLIEILAYLYSQGVEEFPRYRALIDAARNGSLEAVKLLYYLGTIGEDNGMRALRQAALTGHFKVVMFLASKGYRVDITRIVQSLNPEIGNSSSTLMVCL